MTQQYAIGNNAEQVLDKIKLIELAIDSCNNGSFIAQLMTKRGMTKREAYEIERSKYSYLLGWLQALNFAFEKLTGETVTTWQLAKEKEVQAWAT